MKINTKLVVPVVLVAILFAAAVVVTQAGSPSSKTAIAGSATEISYTLDDGIYNEVELADTTIKTANAKDLIISVTAECGLFTDTKLTGKGTKDLNDEDIATIQVWVVVDENTPYERMAFPGKVTFAERIQTMNGRLSNMIWNGTSEEWEDIPEYIELTLNTTNANGFNFMLLDLAPGDHTITVFASVELDESSTSGEVSLNPAGAIGKRTVVVQEVRLVKDTSLP